jgi:hypothetical protein
MSMMTRLICMIFYYALCYVLGRVYGKPDIEMPDCENRTIKTDY